MWEAAGKYDCRQFLPTSRVLWSIPGTRPAKIGAGSSRGARQKKFALPDTKLPAFCRVLLRRKAPGPTSLPIHRPAHGNHPSVYTASVRTKAVGEGSRILIASDDITGGGTGFGQVKIKRIGRLFATRIITPASSSALLCAFRRDDPIQPKLCAIDFNRIAIDDEGASGDLFAGKRGRGGNQRSGKQRSSGDFCFH